MEPFSGRQSRQQAPVHHKLDDEPSVAPRPEPTPVSRETSSRLRSEPPASRRAPKKLLLTLLAVLAGLALLAVLWQMLQGSNVPGVDTSKYQAVFLRDKYVYIGKLSDAGGGYYKLTSVFYPSSATTATSTTTNNTQLVKLGEDLLGADDQMMIAKSQVLSYENLKDDGQAAKAIQSYLKK